MDDLDLEVKKKQKEIDSLLKPLSAEEKQKLHKVEKLQESIATNQKKIQIFDDRIEGLNSNLSSFSKNLPLVMSILGMPSSDTEYKENNLHLLKDHLSEIESRVNCLTEIYGLIENQNVSLCEEN